jgi:hypothetical protein
LKIRQSASGDYDRIKAHPVRLDDAQEPATSIFLQFHLDLFALYLDRFFAYDHFGNDGLGCRSGLSGLLPAEPGER